MPLIGVTLPFPPIFIIYLYFIKTITRLKHLFFSFIPVIPLKLEILFNLEVFIWFRVLEVFFFILKSNLNLYFNPQ